MFTSNYTVSGMTCGNCVKHVTEEVMAIPGVTGIDLVVEGAMRITAQHEISFEAVREAVEEAGDYQVVPA